ncbi:MAG: hypothetical protein L6E13_09065 [Firmicutes bacterium]|nr:hypothetical protein [Bacillota bacterium]
MYPMPGWGLGWGRPDGGTPAPPGGGRGPEAGLADLLHRLEVVTELLLALQADLRRLAEPVPGARDPAPPAGATPARPGAPQPLFRQSRDGRWGSVTYRQPGPASAGGARAWPEPEGPGWAVAGAPPAWFRLSDQRPGGSVPWTGCSGPRASCSWPPPRSGNHSR